MRAFVCVCARASTFLLPQRILIPSLVIGFVKDNSYTSPERTPLFLPDASLNNTAPEISARRAFYYYARQTFIFNFFFYIQLLVTVAVTKGLFVD